MSTGDFIGHDEVQGALDLNLVVPPLATPAIGEPTAAQPLAPSQSKGEPDIFVTEWAYIADPRDDDAFSHNF
ncbi:MAG TPA: hypothetical protein VED59_09180 [Acidimicrobiales bacterium]|nr:hypothetical protein [Acidimicrobiales bacterium]